MKLVDETAATIPDYGSVVGIYRNHLDVCKFESQSDRYYKEVLEKLQSLAQVQDNSKKPTVRISSCDARELG